MKVGDKAKFINPEDGKPGEEFFILYINKYYALIDSPMGEARIVDLRNIESVSD
jgi:hypothetical protein